MIKWSHKKSLLKIDSKMKTQFLQKQCFIISPFIKQGGKNIESTLGQSFLKLSDHQNHLKCSFKHRTLIPTSPELNRSGVVLRAYSSYKWSDLAFVCCYENHKMSEAKPACQYRWIVGKIKKFKSVAKRKNFKRK